MVRSTWTSAVVAGLVIGGSIIGGPYAQAAVMVPGDFDHDCDVDSADFAHFRTCALGAGVPQTNPACVDARLDADADIDVNDFGIFQRCYSGEGNAADPNCNRSCVGPDCACLCSQTNCNGTCTCIASDSANCGACGHVCPAGTTCANGSCVQCIFPFIACGGVCVDPTSDRNNCGGCGIQCGPSEACISGFCESGFAAQAGRRGDPSASAPLSTRVCPQSPSCPPGRTFCYPSCVDLQSDPFNCGVCGLQCAPAEVCAGGLCQGICIGCE